MTTESVYAAITKGQIHIAVAGPTGEENRFIAEYPGGRVGIDGSNLFRGALARPD